MAGAARPWGRTQASKRRADLDGLDARLRLLATETDVLLESESNDKKGQNFEVLSFTADRFSYYLRDLYPGWGFPWGCTCLFLDGKVYAIGGEKPPRVVRHDVFVIDLARGSLSRWEQCQSMPHAYTLRWGVGVVVRGKIFFMKTTVKSLCGAFVQVYDPAADTWELIEIALGATCFDVVPGLADAWIAQKKLKLKFSEKFSP